MNNNNSFSEMTKEHGFVFALVVFIVALGIIFGIFYLDAFLAALLWNEVFIALFPYIGSTTVWQMLGLQIMLSLIFPNNLYSCVKTLNHKD